MTRSVVLSITKEKFQLFFEEAPEAIADFEVKLARYDVRLRSVLYHPVGMQFFADHLKREYSEENLEFWKQCRDFRHLSYADVPKDAAMRAQLEAELQADVETDVRQLASSSSPDTTSPISPRARRASLSRLHGLDIGAAFDLFVDATVRVSRAARGDEFLSVASLAEMLRFFAIPLATTTTNNNQDDINTTGGAAAAATTTALLDEMAAQLGYDASQKHGYISRGDFVRVLVDIEHGKFVEASRRQRLSVKLEQLSVDLLTEHRAQVSTEWAATQPSAADPTSEYLPPSGGESIAAGVAAASVSCSTISAPPSSSPSPAPQPPQSPAGSSLSLASKLLLKLTRTILDLRVAKLKAAFDLYDVSRSGTIELPEFHDACTQLGVETSAAKVTDRFRNVDLVDGTGSISLLEFVAYIFHDRQQAHALQALLDRRAREIYDTFISNRAPKQVNIRGPSQRRLKDLLETQQARDSRAAASPKSANSLPTPTPTTSNRHATNGAAGAEPNTPSSGGSSREDANAAANGNGTTNANGNSRITSSIFDDAAEEVMKLMSADSFSRFKQSDLFQQFLLAAGAYNFQGPSLLDDTKLRLQPETPKKPKTRSGTVASTNAAAANGRLTSQTLGGGGGAAGGGQSLSHIQAHHAQQDSQAFMLRTAQGLVLTEESAELDSDNDDFSPPPPPPPAMQVQVVDMEQIGVEILTSSPVRLSLGGDPAAAAAGANNNAMPRHRASLILPPRPIVGRPTTRSVFYTHTSAPIGVNTLRATSDAHTRGPITDAFFAAIDDQTAAAAAATVAATQKSTPPVRVHAAVDLHADTSDDEDLPPPPREPAAMQTPPRGAAAAASAASGVSTTTPVSPASPPPLDTSDEATEGDFSTPDRRGVYPRKSILQSPSPPPNLPADAADLDKNPLQSPLVGRRASDGPASLAFHLAPFASGAGTTVRADELEADPDVPPPPQESFNDADLDKGPLQSPAIRRSSQHTLHFQ